MAAQTISASKVTSFEHALLDREGDKLDAQIHTRPSNIGLCTAVTTGTDSDNDDNKLDRGWGTLTFIFLRTGDLLVI